MILVKSGGGKTVEVDPPNPKPSQAKNSVLVYSVPHLPSPAGTDKPPVSQVHWELPSTQAAAPATPAPETQREVVTSDKVKPAAPAPETQRGVVTVDKAKSAAPDDVLRFALEGCVQLLRSTVKMYETDVVAATALARQFQTCLRPLAAVYGATQEPSADGSALGTLEDSTGELFQTSEKRLLELYELVLQEPTAQPLSFTRETITADVQQLVSILEGELVYRSKDEAAKLLDVLVRTRRPLSLDERFNLQVLPLLREEQVDPLLHYWPRFDELRPAGRLAPAQGMGFPDHAAQRELVRKRFALPRRFPALVKPHQHLHVVGPKGCGKKFLARAAHVLIHVENDAEPFTSTAQPLYTLDARALLQQAKPEHRAAMLTSAYAYLQTLVRSDPAAEEGTSSTADEKAKAGCTLGAKVRGPPSVRTLLVTHVHELGADVPRPHAEEHPNVLVIFTSEATLDGRLESDVEVRVALPTFAVRRAVVLHTLFETLQVGTLVPEGAAQSARAAVAAGFFENKELRAHAERIARATGPDWSKVRDAVVPRGADEHAWNLLLLEQTAALPPEVIVHHFARKPHKARALLQKLKEEPPKATEAAAEVDSASVREVLSKLDLDTNESAREEEEAKRSEELRRELLQGANSAPLALAWDLERAERYAAELQYVCNVEERISNLTNRDEGVKCNIEYIKMALKTGSTLLLYPKDDTGKASMTGDLKDVVEELQKNPSQLANFSDERHLLRFVAQLEGTLDRSKTNETDEYKWVSAPERCATFGQSSNYIVPTNKRFEKLVERYRQPEPLVFRHDLTKEDELQLYRAVFTKYKAEAISGETKKNIWDDFETTFAKEINTNVKEMILDTFDIFKGYLFVLNNEVKAEYQPLGLVAQTLYYAHLANNNTWKTMETDETLFPYYVRFRNALIIDGVTKVHVYCSDVDAEESTDRRGELAKLRAKSMLAQSGAALAVTHAAPVGLSDLRGARDAQYARALHSQAARLPTFHRLDALHSMPLLLLGSPADARVRFLGAQDRDALARRVQEYKRNVDEIKKERYNTLVKKKSEWKTALDSGTFCEKFRLKVRWEFVSGADESVPALKTDGQFATHRKRRSEVREQWLKKLQDEPEKVDWAYLQRVYSRFQDSLFPDGSAPAPANVFMFVAESALRAPRATTCPEAEAVLTAFLEYAYAENVKSKVEQEKLQTARTRAAYTHAANVFLECLTKNTGESGSTEPETAARKTLLEEPAQPDVTDVRNAFWALVRVTALSVRVEAVHTYLTSTKAWPAERPMSLRYVTGFDQLLQAPSGAWRQRLAEVKVYTAEKAKRAFRRAQLVHAAAEAALRAPNPARLAARANGTAVAQADLLDARAARLYNNFVAKSPFGFTCAELAAAVRRGTENFLFCKLALKFDAAERCYFYCFQDATLQKVRCAHEAPSNCQECPPADGRARTFLRDLNLLLFDVEGAALPAASERVRTDDAFAAAASTAELLLSALQRVQHDNDTMFQTLRAQFEKSMRAAGEYVAPRSRQTFSENVLFKRRAQVRAATRFVQEGLLEAILDALADAQPLGMEAGASYLRNALRQYQLEQ